MGIETETSILTTFVHFDIYFCFFEIQNLLLKCFRRKHRFEKQVKIDSIQLITRQNFPIWRLRLDVFSSQEVGLIRNHFTIDRLEFIHA